MIASKIFMRTNLERECKEDYLQSHRSRYRKNDYPKRCNGREKARECKEDYLISHQSG